MPVFSHSHLGFGNKAVLSSLSTSEAAACLAAGVNSSWEPGNKSADYLKFLQSGASPFWFVGHGDFAACDQAVRRVLMSFDRAGQPSLAHAATTRFAAMSLFFYVRTLLIYERPRTLSHAYHAKIADSVARLLRCTPTLPWPMPSSSPLALPSSRYSTLPRSRDTSIAQTAGA